MKRHFYGFEWRPYGVCADGDSGQPIGRLHKFDSKAERDNWVSCGASYRTESGFREAVTSTWCRNMDRQVADE